MFSQAVQRSRSATAVIEDVRKEKQSTKDNLAEKSEYSSGDWKDEEVRSEGSGDKQSLIACIQKTKAESADKSRRRSGKICENAEVSAPAEGVEEAEKQASAEPVAEARATLLQKLNRASDEELVETGSFLNQGYIVSGPPVRFPLPFNSAFVKMRCQHNRQLVKNREITWC